MNSRNPLQGTMALAALAVALVVGADLARAQLPPAPSDAPPPDRSAVRPTPAPRTPPPPPPDSRRPRAAPTDASGPATPPPPPPEVAPPPAPSAPAMTAPAQTADKIFATRGVVELGGSFDFSAQRDQVDNATWLNLGLDAYAGYFVAKYFTLGLYLSMRFSQYDSDESTVWSVVPGFLLAPGVAVRLMRRVFFYGDVLVGLYGAKVVHNDYNASRDTDLYGTLGGEAGVKLRMTGRCLVRLGVRFTYDIGKRSSDPSTGAPIESDIGRFTILFRIGFSGFL